MTSAQLHLRSLSATRELANKMIDSKMQKKKKKTLGFNLSTTHTHLPSIVRRKGWMYQQIGENLLYQ